MTKTTVQKSFTLPQPPCFFTNGQISPNSTAIYQIAHSSASLSSLSLSPSCQSNHYFSLCLKYCQNGHKFQSDATARLQTRTLRIEKATRLLFKRPTHLVRFSHLVFFVVSKREPVAQLLTEEALRAISRERYWHNSK